MTDRATFMASVRAALEDVTSTTPTTHQDGIERLVRRADDTDDVVARFTAMAEDAGMTVLTAAPETFAKTLVEAVGDRGPVAVAVADVAWKTRVMESLTTVGLAAGDATTLDALFEAGVSITDVGLVIAETGSLVVHVAAGCPRGAAVIGPDHVAIVRTDQIVPDLIDGLAMIQDHRSAPGASVSVMITGPSKTADIEGILVTGVHGPTTVTVVLVDVGC